MRRATTTTRVRRCVALGAIGLVAPLLAGVPGTQAVAAPPRPGTVTASAPLRHDLWIPKATSRC